MLLCLLYVLSLIQFISLMDYVRKAREITEWVLYHSINKEVSNRVFWRCSRYITVSFMVEKDLFLKFDFKINAGNLDYSTMNIIKQCLQVFNDNIVHRGNNLKTPTFHQIFHAVDYITRYSYLMNYVGSILSYVNLTNNRLRTLINILLIMT